MSIIINSTTALDNRLTTVENVLQELGSTGTTGSSVFINRLIKRASYAIEALTSNSFQLLDVTESLDSQGGVKLVLERTPVRSVTSVTFDGSTISSTTYNIDNPKAGILFRPAGWTSTLLRRQYLTTINLNTGLRDWAIRYTAGYVLPNSTAYTASTAKLPDDVEQAAIIAVSSWFINRGGDRNVKSEKIGQAFESRFEGDANSGGLPPLSTQLLKEYMRVSI